MTGAPEEPVCVPDELLCVVDALVCEDVVVCVTAGAAVFEADVFVVVVLLGCENQSE